MKKLIGMATLGAAGLALAACGSSDDASSDLEVDSVEMPANEPLEAIEEEPVEDTAAQIGPVETPAAVSQETASKAADRAETVAAEAAAAAEAAEAAEAAANLDLEVE